MSANTESGATRASLLSRARQQDSAAWGELAELYGPLVAYWCRRCGMDTHESADCVQEVFAAVARSLDRFEPQRASGAFRSWLWTITSNKIRDSLRRKQREAGAAGGTTALQAWHQLADPVSVPDAEPTEREQISGLLRRGLEQVRDEFAAKTWAIFERAVIDAVPTAEVAQQFEVTPAAVRQARSRVLRRLRQQLGDLEED